MDLESKKSELRKKFLALRKFFSERERQSASKEIAEKLIELKEVKSASVILSYKCIGSEVDLDAFNCELEKSGKKINYPEKTVEQTRKNYDLVLVPGVAFDLRGYRLGRGGGFYDKLLPELKCTKIGIAFDMQVIEQLPHETHDAKVDFIITEKQLIRF